jgi:hypothetical protein
MSFRQILPLAVLVTALVPASALAAPTVTVTGDDGNPVPLNTTEPVTIRNMDASADVAVPTTDTRYYTMQVLDGGNAPASPISGCRDTRYSPRRRTTPSTAATGPTPCSSGTTTPPGTPTATAL